MTRPLITWPEPTVATRDVLRALLADRPEPHAQGVTVSTKPRDGAEGARPTPYVHVRLDGAFRSPRLNGRASVRLVVWHDDAGLANELALLIEGLLLAGAHSPAIRGFSYLTGPLPAEDPDTSEPITALTITARLRPVQHEGDT